ncbi:MAG: 30S ribosomal protein S20 [Candidatus Pacebacteria bacterium]|nr:30S ribosomal protein S20 [Candidatus Paceibacterota bacterium]
MAITNAAKKALRQNERRKKGNSKYKNALKSVDKEMKKLIIAGKTQEAKKLCPKLYKAADKAAKAGVIKKNRAARIKSRRTKLSNIKK